MKDNVELKACPFCDSNAKILTTTPFSMVGEPEVQFYPSCTKKGCPAVSATDGEFHYVSNGCAFSTHEEAVTAWNTRPSEAVEAVVDERPDIIHMGHSMGKDFVPWSKEGEVIAALTQPSPPITDETATVKGNLTVGDEKRKAALALVTSKIGKTKIAMSMLDKDDLMISVHLGQALTELELIETALSQPDKTSVPQEDWQLIESAPMDGTHIQVWWPAQYHEPITAFFDNKDNFKWKVSGFGNVINTEPTHWRPLPSPPKTGRDVS